MNIGVWGWDATVADPRWRKIIVDAAGHLQVDVLTSGLPLGGATAANQATIIGHIDGIEGALGQCYGWDTANWLPLRFEAVAVPNLRVKLFDGANGIDSHTGAGPIADTTRGLIVHSLLKGYAAGALHRIEMLLNTIDAISPLLNALWTASPLYGYNGADWDRLRTYGTGILKVGRAEVGLLDVRLIAVGQVGAAGARKLYWLTTSPSGANANIELADAAAGGGAVKWDWFCTDRHSHHMVFDPPMEFSTGIFLETFDNMTAVTFGYL